MSKWSRRKRFALLADFSRLVMVNGYYKSGIADREVAFEYSFDALPPHASFVVSAGLEQFLDYIYKLYFSEDDLEYLAQLEYIDSDFINDLRDFEFTGDIWAVPEGRVVLPGEPIVRVEARLAEAELIGTALQNALNYPSLVATKAARFKEAAGDDLLIESGLWGAPGADGGLTGSRAAFVGGVSATTNTMAAKEYNIPVYPVCDRYFRANHPDHASAFLAMAEVYGDRTSFLIDENDLENGALEAAVALFVKQRESDPDLCPGVSIKAESPAGLLDFILDAFAEADFEDISITAVGEYDEYLVAELKHRETGINAWSLGANLLALSDYPLLKGVYRQVAFKDDDIWKPSSEQASCNDGDSGRKKVVRYYGESGILADVVYAAEEKPPEGDTIEGYDRDSKRRRITGITDREELFLPVVTEGSRVTEIPSLESIKKRLESDLGRLGGDQRRLRNPAPCPVLCSPQVFSQKNQF